MRCPHIWRPHKLFGQQIICDWRNRFHIWMSHANGMACKTGIIESNRVGSVESTSIQIKLYILCHELNIFVLLWFIRRWRGAGVRGFSNVLDDWVLGDNADTPSTICFGMRMSLSYYWCSFFRMKLPAPIRWRTVECVRVALDVTFTTQMSQHISQSVKLNGNGKPNIYNMVFVARIT